MTKEEVREKFLDSLLRKPVTLKQAYDLLEKLKAPEEVIDSLINEAENSGLLDYELSSRGVSRRNIAQALEESQDESQRACEIAQNLRDYGLDEKKIAARLRSRGFTNRAIESALELLE